MYEKEIAMSHLAKNWFHATTWNEQSLAKAWTSKKKYGLSRGPKPREYLIFSIEIRRYNEIKMIKKRGGIVYNFFYLLLQRFSAVLVWNVWNLRSTKDCSKRVKNLLNFMFVIVDNMADLIFKYYYMAVD